MGLFGQMDKALGSKNCSKVGFLLGMNYSYIRQVLGMNIAKFKLTY